MRIALLVRSLALAHGVQMKGLAIKVVRLVGCLVGGAIAGWYLAFWLGMPAMFFLYAMGWLP